MKKKGYLGNKEIEYEEEELNGEYAFINGEWIFLRRGEK